MIGKVIGKCKVIAEIGRGGMGVVYKGRQFSLDRDVAIKALSPSLTHDVDAVLRFKKEAILIAQLNHPNIIQIYEIEEVEGQFYIIMEYLDGVSLDKIIRHNALSYQMEDYIDVVKRMCDALSATHDRGIVHRDVKASNIFVTWDKHVKLMDFGISKTVQSTMMTTGVAIGTPSYMSPEQATGKSIDAASDIYSLGVVLYECLTGDLPFTGEDPFSVALKHVHEQPVPPKKLNPAISFYLEKACLIAMEKDKVRRFKNCKDFSMALSGQFPDYLLSEIKTIYRLKNQIENLFKEKAFLPGMTLITLLCSVMVRMQISEPVAVPLNSDSPVEMASVSKPIFETTVEADRVDISENETSASKTDAHQESQEIHAGQDARILTSDSWEILDMAIRLKQFGKANSILNDFEKTHPDLPEVKTYRERYQFEKKSFELHQEMQKAFETENWQEALNKVRMLRVLYPDDEILKSQERTVIEGIEKEEKRKRLFVELEELKGNMNLLTLKTKLDVFLTYFPADVKGREINVWLTEQTEQAEKMQKVQSYFDEAKLLFEAGEFKLALKNIHQLMKMDPEHSQAAGLKKQIEDKWVEVENSRFISGEEIKIKESLQDFKNGLSLKNFEQVVHHVDRDHEAFYEALCQNFSTLFEMSRHIDTSLVLVSIEIDNELARAALFWRISAKFTGSDQYVNLFDRQVTFLLKSTGLEWKIIGMEWLKQ